MRQDRGKAAFVRPAARRIATNRLAPALSLLCILLATPLAGQSTAEAVAATIDEPPSMKRDVTLYGYEVVRSYPHDPAAFTQGLEFHDGRLYEGTGQEGESSLREVELETGRVLRKTDLAPELFGEGITVWRDSVIQLTWEDGVAFVYDLETFERRLAFEYEGEGWGLTHDGSRLVMSDGSSTLTFRDPETFAVTGSIDVTLRGRRLEGLNELEMIDGRIWANVWMTNQIVIIDPLSGRVTGVVDLTGILTPRDREGRDVDVLNGIAHDPATGRIFVTGKYWPRLYEIRLVAK